MVVLPVIIFLVAIREVVRSAVETLAVIDSAAMQEQTRVAVAWAAIEEETAKIRALRSSSPVET